MVGIMGNIEGAHILVVGASGGLGSAISRELAARGARLTLSGRSGDRLSALAEDLSGNAAGAVVAVVPGDLVLPDFPRQLIEQAQAEPGGLAGVVFAAGVVAFGDVEALDDDVLDQLMLVNLLAPIRLIRAAAGVLPAGGFVAVVSAVVAELPTKSMAAYSAAKAGLTAFDKAAAAELRRRRIRVLDIRPTHTETGLADRPIAGKSPALPPGNDPQLVAQRIVQAIIDDEKDLPASAFG
jgi:NAD(P)-dependent dehydrogenase (short-subunit alcohol dehydrogenase family)